MRRSMIVAVACVALIVGLFLCTGAIPISVLSSSFDVEGMLRLRDGQVQKFSKTGEWVCASVEVQEALDGRFVLDIDTTVADTIMDYDVSRREITYMGGFTLAEYDPNTLTFKDVFVRQIAESGRICEVMGHQWNPYAYTYLNYRPSVVADHRCGLCEATRVLTQEWSME